jgi:PKD repeat protein
VKRFRWLLIGLLLVVMLIPVVSAEQITNGGFEIGNMSGWTIYGAAINDTVEKHAGTYSGKLPDWYYYTNISQNVDFTNVNNITFWTYHFGTGMTLQVDSDVVYTFSSTHTEWTYVSVAISPYSGTHKLTITGNQDNNFWIDDISALSEEPALGTTALYPLNASFINGTKILPNSDTTLPPAGSVLAANVTAGDYEAVSFVAKPSVAVTDMTVIASNLTDVTNASNTMPLTAINTKIVGVWYQMSSYCEDNAPSYDRTDCITANPKPSFVITPELLLDNKSLIRTNYTAQTNEVWVDNATYHGYVHIDNTTIGQFKSDYKIFNNQTSGNLTPFASAANENNQIWITVHPPTGTRAGNYTANITVNSSATTLVNLTVNIRVLPFTLLTASMDYGLYYMPPFSSAADHNDIRWAYYRQLAPFQAELQNMKDHGILYPTFPQLTDDADLETALTAWDTIGFPKDKIYLLGLPGYGSYIGAGTGDASNATIAAMVTNWKGHATAHGYTDTYFHGIEELDLATIGTQRQAWTAVHSVGGKVWTGGEVNAISSVADILDVGINAYIQNTTTVGVYHSYNHKLYNYGNPQGGYENPERYRSRYGLPMWANGYDGEMTYAYQALRGGTADALWNEYDAGSSPIKGAMLTYPTTDGVVDTIAWEGFREAVDDSRYADELTRRTGSRTAALDIINAGIADGVDMSVIRGNLIDAILALGDAVIPTASFTKNATSAVQPGSFLFNDTSTNTPTMWNWSFGDANWTNTTTAASRNVTHTYPSIGSYNVSLIVSNAAGSNRSANQTVTVTSPATIPTADFTAAAAGSTVTFFDLSNNTPTSYIWQYNQHEAPAWVQFSTDANPSYDFVPGTYDINLTATNAAGSDSEVKTSYLVVSAGGEGTTFPDAPATDYQEAKARYASDNEGMITAMILIFLVAAIVGVAIAIKCIREGITEATFPLIVGYFIGVFILVILFAAIPAFAYIGEV